MPREPDKRVKKAYELYKKGVKLIEISKELDVPAGTIRRWKSTYGWDSERSDKKANVRNEKKREKKLVADEDVERVMENAELTEKQRLFCLYYIRYFNATKAYQKAYGTDREIAMAAGSRMLRNVKVKEEIQNLKQNRLNREMIDEHDIFQKYIDIAFADITDFVEFGQKEVQVMSMYGPVEVKDPETGEKKPLMKMVNTVTFRESADVDGSLISEVKQGKDGASIKLADRMKALDWLADHLDLATEEQRARIALLKARSEAGGTEEIADDGFLEALNGSAAEDCFSALEQLTRS